ncbi:hypothetical protein [Lachnoclostridium sp. Marseille-P6806]|uniref:hypothetical protein n=1 Tax=Lachnoclostridium sp. Marseille-P6806 TaxID=2364793 RepID=UPI002ED6B9B7
MELLSVNAGVFCREWIYELVWGLEDACSGNFAARCCARSSHIPRCEWRRRISSTDSGEGTSRDVDAGIFELKDWCMEAS